jgi:hypothetical protein
MRRRRALSNRQSPSRYSRFDDGHPSPSPNREWIDLVTTGTSPTIKNPLWNGSIPPGLRLTTTDHDKACPIRTWLSAGR